MFVIPWFLEEIGEETSDHIENEYSGYSLSDRDRTNLPLLSVAMSRAVVHSLWYHAFWKLFPSPNPGRALPQPTLRLWLPPVRLSSGFPTQWFYAGDQAMTESDRWTCQFTHIRFPMFECSYHRKRRFLTWIEFQGIEKERKLQAFQAICPWGYCSIGRLRWLITQDFARLAVPQYSHILQSQRSIEKSRISRRWFEDRVDNGILDGDNPFNRYSVVNPQQQLPYLVDKSHISRTK